VVNTAAYTAVDAAEDDADAAFRANRDGPAELARLCEAAGIPLIHISTDYVFDGLKGAPYVETDVTSPQGVYGASKLAGEAAVLAGCSRGIVVRTSWLYSPTGKNFVRTMLAAGSATGIAGRRDQTGCPTSARIWRRRFSGWPHG
jgi:dTDP-4-dehydrorhamnose reductase